MEKHYYILLIIFFLITLTISTIDIIKWKLDLNKTDKLIKEIQDFIEIEEVIKEDITEEIEIIEQIEEIPQSNPYWDYINMNLINVDFNKLKRINSNTKGWIQVNGTNINYPFVQANDNKYYLTHSFNKSYNSAG